MYVTWSELFEIGIPKIDAEHRHLTGIVNAFHDVVSAGEARGKVFAVLNLLTQYVEIHFRNEEALMEAGKYPGLLAHRREHERLTVQIFELAERYEAGAAQITTAVMDFLKNWLLDHILQEDRKIGEYFRGREVPAAWRADADESVRGCVGS